jgi:hypothetical protein
MGAIVTPLGTAKKLHFLKLEQCHQYSVQLLPGATGRKLKKTGADLLSPGSHAQLGWRSLSFVSDKGWPNLSSYIVVVTVPTIG